MIWHKAAWFGVFYTFLCAFNACIVGSFHELLANKLNFHLKILCNGVWIKKNKTEKQSKDALVKLIIYKFVYQIYNIEHLFNAAQFGILRPNKFRSLRQIYSVICNQYILQFLTNTFSSLRKNRRVHIYIC